MADADAPPPPIAAPEVLAGLELANRRFELLERRIAAWERRLAALEADLAEDGEAPGPNAELLRFDDLEARVSRLERKRFEMLSRRGSAGAGGGSAAGGYTPSVAPPEDGDAPRALVHASWAAPEVEPGGEIALGVMVDGLAADAIVAFVITELDRPDDDPTVLTAPVGEGDRVEVSWKAPKSRRKLREFTFVARCDDLTSRSGVLAVRKAR